MNITLIGIDIAKRVFHLHARDAQGQCMEKKLSREKFLPFIKQLSPCLIVMEACGSANYWARQFKSCGHDVKLISPQFVKPFVKSNKNDARDAEAIAEAATRPGMRFVLPKAVQQQDIQNLHRMRALWVKQRTAVCNQVRGLLAEYGIIVAKGVHQLRAQLSGILEDAENELTSMTREMIDLSHTQLKQLDEQLKKAEQQLERAFKESPVCQRLGQVAGVGTLTATALVASVGDPKQFSNGREMAAWLGLVPRQHSTGGKPRLLGISKRGDCYLRTLLIHGARSALKCVDNKNDKVSRWATNKKLTIGQNKAAVALANKNARILWSLYSQETEYRIAV